MANRSLLSTEAKKPPKPARITYLRVENFRALRKVELKNVTPLTVLLGPNGSGKSTIFDVFAFLSECFDSGLRRAWDRRGRAKELKTRGSIDRLVIEIKFSEPGFPLITYHLAVDERNGSPVVVVSEASLNGFPSRGIADKSPGTPVPLPHLRRQVPDRL